MNVFRKAYRRWRVYRICKACDLKLYPHVKDAVISGDTREIVRWGRQSGKTVAAILFALVDPRATLKQERDGVIWIPDPDMWRGGRNVAMWVSKEFLMYYRKCSHAGIKVPEIRSA